MGSEDWRLRRADELFGPGRLTAGDVPRPPAPERVREGVLPIIPPAAPVAPAAAAIERPPIAPDPPPLAPVGPSLYRAKPIEAPPPRAARVAPASAAPAPVRSRAGSRSWTVLGVIVVLLVGGLIGWIARGPARSAVASHPAAVASVAARRASVARVAVPAAPRAMPASAAPPAARVAVPDAPRAAPAVAAPPVATVRVPAAAARPAHVATPRSAKRLSGSTAAPTIVAAAKPVRAAVSVAATRPMPVPRRARLASAPSYDCRRNHGAITSAICDDPALSALDRQLSARFAVLDAREDPATVQRLHRGETAFLNARQSCPDRACLIDAYRTRLRELDE